MGFKDTIGYNCSGLGLNLRKIPTPSLLSKVPFRNPYPPAVSKTTELDTAVSRETLLELYQDTLEKMSSRTTCPTQTSVFELYMSFLDNILRLNITNTHLKSLRMVIIKKIYNHYEIEFAKAQS